MKPQKIVTLHANAHETIKYFYEIGMIDNLHGDQQYYVEALIKFVVNKMYIELVG